MKSILFTTVALAFVHVEMANAQTESIKESPFTHEASYVGDGLHNFAGGLKKGSTYLGMANLKIGFDTEKAGLWKGGEFFVNAANTHGGEPSATLIGDYQVASNIEAGELTYLHELWFKQSIGKATLIFGLQDLCVEFVSSENASLFLNSSCGVHSTVATNLAVPIFPLTALGAQFHYNFTDNFTFKVAAFDGVPDDFSINKHNVKWKLSQNDGYLSFAEFSYKNSSETYPGTYKLGSYYHNNHKITVQTEDSSPLTENHAANYGIYLVVDQRIFKTETGKELSFFTQTSISPKSINENWFYMGGGFNYKGLCTNRISDVLGLAVAHSDINNAIGSETTFELTYKAQLGENFFIQPDIQYIINPAGTDIKLKNSMVGIVRFGLNF